MDRIRRKKCDETRPVCTNCSSTGRKCDGYAEVQPPTLKSSSAAGDSGESQTSQGSKNVKGLALKSNVGLLLPSAGKIGLSTHECFFLDFFRNMGAIDVASKPVHDFLYGVVSQLGESQPSVKHAAMAMTAKCHSRAKCYFGDAFEKQASDFALRQTSKSITHLLQQSTPQDIVGRRAHREVVMSVCCILAVLANAVGDLETSKMHLMHGQRAMQEWQDVGFDGSSIAPTLSVLLADMTWKLQLASNPASFLQDDNPILLNLPVSFNFDAEYAITHFYLLSGIILDCERQQEVDFIAREYSTDEILRGWRIGSFFRVRIYAWELKSFIEEIGLSAPQSIQDLLMALRLWEQTACAMVAAALANDEAAIFEPSQMAYDALWEYFRSINELGKKMLRSLMRQNGSMPILQIDWAVGTPLFFCGFRCRDWSIRREALRLLRALGERFKGLDAAAFLPMKISALERIIDIESYGLRPGDAVPELARIRYVEFTRRTGSSNIRFSYRPVGTDGLIEIL